MICSQRAILPIQLDVTALYIYSSNGSLVHIFLNFNFPGLVLQPAAVNNSCLARFKILKKYTKRPLLSAEGCQTRPDHSAEKFAEGRRALKAF